MQPQKILVTGGAGYIGSVLIGQLLHKGYAVRTIDNLSFGSQPLKNYISNDKFEFMQGDIRNRYDCQKATESIDTIIHLAAIVGDPACQKYPDLAIAVNRQGSQNLLDSANETQVQRFIFASTCSNYGKMKETNGYVDESTSLNPVSLYAELKVEFEQKLLSLTDTDITPICLRFATAYGLSPRIRLDLTVNEFTKELALGRELEVYGEQFWRPYCHTTDIAQAILLAVEANKEIVSHKAFNVGDTDENYQKKTLIDLILSELPEAKNRVQYVSKNEDPRDYRVNFDRIKNSLSFENKKRVIDGIREFIDLIRSKKIEDPDNKIYKNI